MTFTGGVRRERSSSFASDDAFSGAISGACCACTQGPAGPRGPPGKDGKPG